MDLRAQRCLRGIAPNADQIRFYILLIAGSVNNGRSGSGCKAVLRCQRKGKVVAFHRDPFGSMVPAKFVLDRPVRPVHLIGRHSAGYRYCRRERLINIDIALVKVYGRRDDGNGFT